MSEKRRFEQESRLNSIEEEIEKMGDVSKEPNENYPYLKLQNLQSRPAIVQTYSDEGSDNDDNLIGAENEQSFLITTESDLPPMSHMQMSG